ncbi:hypothetical protein Gpo141_00006612 [Globisporangium polare]
MSSLSSARSLQRKQSSMSSGPTGLVVKGDYGSDTLVFSDQQICDDLIATIPKLHDAVRRGTKGAQWRPVALKDSVDKYELVPVAAGNDGDDDLDLIHAVVAKTELKCHINEVLNVLINQDSEAYGATMKALNGKKFSQGDVLFQQRCKLVPETKSSSSRRYSLTKDTSNDAQSGLISVKLSSIKPKFSLKFGSKHKRTQRLVFSTFTHKYPSNDRAVHIVKTIPKHVHDKIVPAEDRSSLRRDLDHLGMGFDVQFFPTPGKGSADQTTRIFAHGYASTTPPDAFGQLSQSRLPTYNASELAKRREQIMNPEAKHVLNLLADSLAQFERIIRRRRFGLQSFIYFPKEYENPALLKACSICTRHFKFYRRDFFCQLCGQMACGECSKLYEVEARAGELRQNRVCLTCVVRVDNCVFDDEDVIEALGPIVVANDDREWYDDDRFHFELEDQSETASVSSARSMSSARSSMDNMTEQLYSDDPTQWSLALETLGRLVSPTAKYDYEYLDPAQNERKRKKSKTRKPKTLEQKVRQDVENHLSYSLRVNKDKYKTEDLVVVDRAARDYTLQFDSSKTMSPDQPLAPQPGTAKDKKRVDLIKQAKLLDPTSDNSALNMIAQVAAKRMNCPVGYISVIDETAFHAVATFPQTKFPPMPRNEIICSHTLYEEKPLIVNPSRDMRFRNMPMIKMSESKFYAGFPIRAPDGSVVASLCTTDRVAHNTITAKEYATMESLAQLASELITQKAGY